MGDGTHLDLSRRKVITRLLEEGKTAKDIGMINLFRKSLN